MGSREVCLIKDKGKELFKAINFYNSFWFPKEKIKRIDRKKLPECSKDMRGPGFFEELIERFPKGQVIAKEGENVVGLLLSINAEPMSIETMPTKSDISEIPEGDSITILSLIAPNAEIARSLTNTLRGYCNGNNLFSYAHLLDASNYLGKDFSEEDLLKYLNMKRDDGLGVADNNLELHLKIGFSITLVEDSIRIVRLSHSILSKGYSVLMKKE